MLHNFIIYLFEVMLKDILTENYEIIQTDNIRKKKLPNKHKLKLRLKFRHIWFQKE